MSRIGWRFWRRARALNGFVRGNQRQNWRGAEAPVARGDKPYLKFRAFCARAASKARRRFALFNPAIPLSRSITKQLVATAAIAVPSRTPDILFRMTRQMARPIADIAISESIRILANCFFDVSAIAIENPSPGITETFEIMFRHTPRAINKQPRRTRQIRSQ